MVAPEPVAIVLCDHVYVDTSTQKRALIGLFNQIVATKVPVRQRFCIYASATDIHKGTEFRIEIEHAESGDVIFTAKGPPPADTTPLTVCDFYFDLGITFPHDGLYTIKMWGHDRIILQRPVEVIVKEDTTKEGKGD